MIVSMYNVHKQGCIPQLHNVNVKCHFNAEHLD